MASQTEAPSPGSLPSRGGQSITPQGKAALRSRRAAATWGLRTNGLQRQAGNGADGRLRGEGSGGAISLLETEPDLADVLSDEQRTEAQQFLLPVADVDKGGDVAGALEESGAFGAIVLEGMLVQSLQISEDPTLRLIAPGSFVPSAHGQGSMPVGGARLFVPVPTRLVLLDERLLVAARRWPWIVSSLHARMLEHSERLATQLAICQLPRVEDRLMALMWQLAEFWGRVTPAGTRVPLSLSHEVLGGLVGARRPTVTLALSKLAKQGSLIRQGDEWLILEPPATPVSTEPKPPQLKLTDRGNSVRPAQDPVERRPDELRAVLEQLAHARDAFTRERRRARGLAEAARALREETRRRRTEGGDHSEGPSQLAAVTDQLSASACAPAR